MVLIRPRLNDYHNLPFTQEEVDFAIPFLDEDIPLYLDPFLLWKSPSHQDNSLHTSLINSFNHIGVLLKKDKKEEAIDILIKCSECNEVGLGNSKTRHGAHIGRNVAENILSLFGNIPQVNVSGFVHFEEIQLFVEHISSDRISDFACSFLKSFLIDFTIDQCKNYDIPIDKVQLGVYNYRKNTIVEEETYLPINPSTSEPIIFVPKRWLRRDTWINYQDYLNSYYLENIPQANYENIEHISVLTYNRYNYDVVQTYLDIKEAQNSDCKNDPLFKPIPVTSSKRKLSTIRKLPSGKTDNADRKYEDNVCQLLATLFYPKLDFADEQSRTESGVLIRDLIFYNNRSYDFLKDLYDDYGSQQLIFELKNVKEVTRDHIFQLNRYLNDNFGKFGVIVTRNPPPSKVFRNTIDLWSGQRRCILILDDSDLEMMCLLYETKQRLPIDVLKKKYVEFMRKCPS
nr:hypothetical protein [uncultured Methanolobus sp.]